MRETPEILLDYQKAVLRAVKNNEVIVIEKSRRIGITWALGADAVLTAGKKKGMNVLYVGYNLDMAREFIDEAGRWASKFNIAAEKAREFLFENGDEGAIKAFRIDFASGFEVIALSSNPRSLRGRQGKVIIDEAAFHPDLAGVLKSALALLIWGGKVVVVSTHFGQANPFNELVSDIRAGRKTYGLLRITFADALAEGLYERVCLKTNKIPTPAAKKKWADDMYAQYGSDAAEELDCIPSLGGGAFLSLVLLEARTEQVPVVRWEERAEFSETSSHIREAATRDWCEQNLAPLLAELDRGSPSCMGVDFGRSVDLTVFWPLITEKNLHRSTPFVVELSNIPFEQQKQVGRFLGERLPRFRRAELDATGNGAYLAETMMQQFGSARVGQVKLSPEWYRQHMPRLKAALEDEKLTLPADEDIIGDLRSLVMKDGVAQVPKNARRRGRSGGERHGDAAIAACLAWAASEGGSPLMEYKSGGSRIGGSGGGNIDMSKGFGAVSGPWQEETNG